VVLHLSQVSSCRVLIKLSNNVLNFAVFTTVFEFKIWFSGVNKHSLLPWQQFSYDLNNDHFRTSPRGYLLAYKFKLGGQNVSFPTLFDSYRELLLINWTWVKGCNQQKSKFISIHWLQEWKWNDIREPENHYNLGVLVVHVICHVITIRC